MRRIRLAAIIGLGLLGALPARAAPTVTSDIKHDLSLPWRYLATHASRLRGHPREAEPVRRLPLPPEALVAQPDAALQTQAGPPLTVVPGHAFAGVGQGDYGYTVEYAPPDTNLAVGATQVMQQANSAVGVFSKKGALLLAVRNTNTLWAGFGGPCETNNDGDGIVKYDRISGRWVVTQFSATAPYLECVAVSQTKDATGAYYRYSFPYGSVFPDYPKIGVWPDAYYFTYNMFGSRFQGANICAMPRKAMTQGQPATQQCFQLSSSYGGLLPADLDGATAPPTGAGEYLLNYGSKKGSGILNVWTLKINWKTPASSRLKGPAAITVPAFTAACGGGTCIPQSGTTRRLEILADRLMYRLAYRNFGDHQSLVVTHSVTAGTSTGLRWYELRATGGDPAFFQAGTFAPDSAYRWMGSIAMDKVGDMALGYSASSSTDFPSIRYTGRVPTDALGTMSAEVVAIGGAGSQSGLSRWGDYSTMALDPVDDCTFYFTSEYLKATGSFNWSTWINSFKFPGCV